jgi:hypothetical protein
MAQSRAAALGADRSGDARLPGWAQPVRCIEKQYQSQVVAELTCHLASTPAAQTNPGNGRRLLEDGQNAVLTINPMVANFVNRENISSSLAWVGTVSKEAVLDGCRCVSRMSCMIMLLAIPHVGSSCVCSWRLVLRRQPQ